MSIVFNGLTKTIELSSGTTTLDIRDVWSRWVDWFLTSDNSKFLPTFINLGGDDIDPSSGTKVPVYVFLINGWKIRPQSSHHTLNIINGILLVYGGGDPFVDPIGDYVVRINYQQPVQAISFSSEGGGTLTQEQISTAVWGVDTPLSYTESSAKSLVLKIEKLIKENQALILA